MPQSQENGPPTKQLTGCIQLVQDCAAQPATFATTRLQTVQDARSIFVQFAVEVQKLKEEEILYWCAG